MEEVEAAVELLKAVMEFSRTGVKPDWIEVDYRRHKDCRPKQVKSQEELEEIDRKKKELWELYSHGNGASSRVSREISFHSQNLILRVAVIQEAGVENGLASFCIWYGICSDAARYTPVHCHHVWKEDVKAAVDTVINRNKGSSAGFPKLRRVTAEAQQAVQIRGSTTPLEVRGLLPVRAQSSRKRSCGDAIHPVAAELSLLGLWTNQLT
ncbi:hypothetical protein SELMODRAFT_422638 [Selaginella moellendorffii]|uniref:Uncharacterized protein n=1 Tax=Selaginella moellendorffii TaxID=88036 RepID=D8SJ24_SELML|nr:hypothetical protein SELMODRAFT_422638 [Selaginella moellendorffii]